MAGDKKDKAASVEPFKPHPPTWRPPIHPSSTLGWPDYVPDHPDRMENVMSTKTIKDGLSIPFYASHEGATAHTDAMEKLESEDALKRLGELMTEVLEKRDATMGIPAATTPYKMPPRVTVPDMRRAKWLDALADPNIPLKDIAARASQAGATTPEFYIPHGPKGSELFELLYSRNVPIERAVWFVRIVGYNDMAPLRKQPGYNPMSYSYDTAKDIIVYFKKQLAEISLPTARLQSTALKQTFKGVLLDPESRIAWCSKFVYTIQLTREFYKESMIDHGTFLLWAAQHIGVCNLAQLALFARLVDEYCVEMCTHRAFAKALVDNSLLKLKELEASSGANHLEGLQTLLRKFIQLAMMDVPEAFIGPRKWPFNVEGIFDVIDAYVPLNPETKDEIKEQTRIQLQRTAQEMHRRNCALLFYSEPSQPKGSLGQTIIAIRNLNSLDANSNLATFKFFEDDERSFDDQLKLLLTWAVSRFQYGDHRPYAVGSILRKWMDDAKMQAIRQKLRIKPADALQDKLFQWLHTYPDQSFPADLPEIAILFGELIRRGVFSYARYVQELVARGELERSAIEPSRHVDLIKQIPLIASSEAQELLHRTSLHDRQLQVTPEDEKMLRIQKQLVGALPELFVAAENDQPFPVSIDFSEALSASHYEQARVVHHWLISRVINKCTKKQASHKPATMSLACYAALIQLFSDTKLYIALLEFNLLVLSIATWSDGEIIEESEIFAAVLDTFERHAAIWASLDANASISQGLFLKVQKLRFQSTRNPALLGLIKQSRFWRYLTKQERVVVQGDYNRLVKDLDNSAHDGGAVSSIIPEIRAMIQTTSGVSPHSLAVTLWNRLKTVDDWPVIVWDNVMQGLMEYSLKDSNREERLACSKRLSLVLYQIDQRLLKGFDPFLRAWCERSDGFKVLEMNASQWELLVPLLIKLCISNTASCSTILECFVYPVWRHFAAVASSADSQTYRDRHVPCLFQTAILVLCLLLQNTATAGDGSGLTPISVPQLQRLQTRRLCIYQGAHFQALLQGVCYLVALSINPLLTPEVSTTLLRLKMSLLDDPLFKQQVSRDAIYIKRTFESVSGIQRTSELEDRMEETLMRLMNADEVASASRSDDSDMDIWTRTIADLDPWHCHRAAVKVQLAFRRLCRLATRDPPTYAARLDRDTAALFKHEWSSEQLVYISELLDGIDAKATGELLSKAYARITDALRSVTSNLTVQTVASFNQLVKNTLSLMLKITSPLAIMESAPPDIPASIMENFLQTVCNTWRGVYTRISPYTTLQAMDTKPIDGAVYRDLIMLTTRLVHYALGAMEAASPEWKRLADNLLGLVVQFAVFYGTDGPLRDRIVFLMLFDTACYLIDDIPADPKNPNADLIRVISGVYPSNLSPHISEWHRGRLKKILQYMPRDYYVEDLQHAATSKHAASRVQNRPWEWGESFYKPREMGKQPVEDYAAFPSPNKAPVNMRSISLDLFRAKATRDRVAEPTLFDDPDDGEDNRRVVEERSTGDGLGGETSFARDWRDAKVPINGARLPDQLQEDDTDDEEWPHFEGLSIQDNSAPLPKMTSGAAALTTMAKAARKRPASDTPIDIPDDDDDDDEIVEVSRLEATKPVAGKGKGKGGKAPAASSLARGRTRRASASTSTRRK